MKRRAFLKAAVGGAVAAVVPLPAFVPPCSVPMIGLLGPPMGAGDPNEIYWVPETIFGEMPTELIRNLRDQDQQP